MRLAILCVLGAVLITTAAVPAGDETASHPSTESYVKVRVEVEMRGLLDAKGKTITVATRERVYNLFSDGEEISRKGAPATLYTLDFIREKDLRELAKTLDGKEVVVTGLSELRMVIQTIQPGGVTGAGAPGPIPPHTWTLQRTVEVTGLKSVGGK